VHEFEQRGEPGGHAARLAFFEIAHEIGITTRQRVEIPRPANDLVVVNETSGLRQEDDRAPLQVEIVEDRRGVSLSIDVR
jgi:hypothetical protein